MKSILIAQAQMDALSEMGLRYVVADSEGVVYCAYASKASSEIYAKRHEQVNGRPMSSHLISECVADALTPPSQA